LPTRRSSDLVNIGRDLGIVHRLERGDDLGAEPFGFFRRQRRRGRGDRRLVGLGFAHANKSCALIRASASVSTSASVLYIANDARHVAVSLNRSKSGITQWVPARTATPARSITVATSCGCAPFIVKEISGPRSRGLPTMRSELIARSRSTA